MIRYGAFGDVLQSASILPGLKAQGFHITMYCTPRGEAVLRGNPSIDEFVVQNEDIVPNHELGAFFLYLEKKYTKVINLCETVEGIVLPMSQRAHFHWPKEARHQVCNVNYVELQHKIAGVPYVKPDTRFHPTESERQWALREKGSGRFITWAVSGSAVHKVWPHVDDVISELQKSHPDVTVVLVGGKKEEVLQGDWNHPKVWRKVGDWNIREAMAFAQISDVVVGPETGLLNAVAMEPNGKVLILSHSTVENLSRDWVNTTSLWAENAPCYPCHRLHLDGWKYCNRHVDGAAMCQMMLSPTRVYEAIVKKLEGSA